MKSTKSKTIAQSLLTLLSLALLGYTGYRTIDLISKTLPADRWALALFALAALDGGLLLWLLYYQHGARGAWQRAISLIMVAIDLIGVGIAFTADTLINAGESGLTAAIDSSTTQAVLVALSLVVFANIAAFIIAHLMDPDARQKDAEQDALDEIAEETIKAQRKNAKALAADVAPQLAEHWRQMTRANLLAGIGGAPVGEPTSKTETQAQAEARQGQGSSLPDAPAIPAAPKPYVNGKAKVNLDVPAMPATVPADWGEPITTDPAPKS